MHSSPARYLQPPEKEKIASDRDGCGAKEEGRRPGPSSLTLLCGLLWLVVNERCKGLVHSGSLRSEAIQSLRSLGYELRLRVAQVGVAPLTQYMGASSRQNVLFATFEVSASSDVDTRSLPGLLRRRKAPTWQEHTKNALLRWNQGDQVSYGTNKLVFREADS